MKRKSLAIMVIISVLLMIGGLIMINSIYAYQTKHIDAHFFSTLWYYVKMIPLLITQLSH
ncbi:hypothetical protein [Alkalihalobacillus sp. 1P02AB]|uniref:hypothetical protein n=1 Tax=Alkalihalobacillus sp. 1P02AB TaxID=3132260 RepID=UPI0039A56424